MPQLLEPTTGILEPAPHPVRWTRAQSVAIRESGVLTGRYELIDGVIISKMGQNPAHATGITGLLQWLAEVYGLPFVRVQLAIGVGDADPDHNEPEPDLTVTRLPYKSFSDRHPGPEDLQLVVEVSDTTLRFDRTTKALLYARAGIEEYWILDLNNSRLLVHRQPASHGYHEVIAYGEDEMVATLTRPETATMVGNLLP